LTLHFGRPRRAIPNDGTLKLAFFFGVVPSVAAAWALFWPGRDLLSARGYYIGQDFVNFWMAGHLGLQGRLTELYDLDAYHMALKSTFSSSIEFMNFSYPPNALPLLLPLALLPYGLALLLWHTFGLAALFMCSFAGANRSKIAEFLPYILSSPLLVLVISVGQASCFLASLFVGALRLLPKRPSLAGALLGLLTVKPQLGILLPPALLILGERRAFIAAGATAMLLLALSFALFGAQPWRDYFAFTVPYQRSVVTQMIGLYPLMMVTPYAGFWALGVPTNVALLLHTLIAIGVAAITCLSLRWPVDSRLKIVFLGLSSVIVTPYCLDYDLTLPAAAILCWLVPRTSPVPFPTTLALRAFWAVPLTGVALIRVHLPVTPVAVIALFVVLVRQARRELADNAAGQMMPASKSQPPEPDDRHALDLT